MSLYWSADENYRYHELILVTEMFDWFLIGLVLGVTFDLLFIRNNTKQYLDVFDTKWGQIKTEDSRAASLLFATGDSDIRNHSKQDLRYYQVGHQTILKKWSGL